MKKKYYIIAASVLLLVILDQLTKQYIVKTMDIGEYYTVIENFFLINSHRNTGGAWGILTGQMMIFYLITFIAFVLFYYLLKEVDFSLKKVYSIAVILLIAGAIGNFIDRLLFQEVVDFLDFYIFGYDFPIFNVADMCLVVGMIFFAYDILLEDIIHAKNKS
jgi:signal peptidase II